MTISGTLQTTDKQPNQQQKKKILYIQNMERTLAGIKQYYHIKKGVKGSLIKS